MVDVCQTGETVVVAERQDTQACRMFLARLVNAADLWLYQQ